MRQLAFVFIIAFALLHAGVVSAETDDRAACARGNLLISELDYDQPGVDDGEFVEIFGTPNSSLDDFELHLVDSGGTLYRNIALDGNSITPSGFFVVGNRDLFYDPQLQINSNSISNDKGVVGIYDTRLGAYCNAINYEGTVSGYSDWFNIGFDSADHGHSRGCARAASGWWSCNRPTTPGGSNGVVAVELSGANVSDSLGMVLVVLVSCALSTATLRSVSRR